MIRFGRTRTTRLTSERASSPTPPGNRREGTRATGLMEGGTAVREVPAKLYGFLTSNARACGLDVARASRGLRLAMVDVDRVGERVDWDELALFLDRLYADVTDEEIIASGERLVEVHEWTRVMASVVLTARQLYGVAWEMAEPAYPHLDLSVNAARDPLRVAVRIPPSHRACRSMLLCTIGEMRALPTLLGLPMARVRADVGSRHGVYEIHVPEAASGSDEGPAPALDHISGEVLELLHRSLRADCCGPMPAPSVLELQRAHGFTRAEARVAHRLAMGLGVSEVAASLGVSRNTVLRDPHPLYAARGEGCRIIDIEGVSRIDFSNNMASLIHGHACPAIVRAVTEQAARGTAFMMATEAEVLFAERLCARNRSFEKIRFVNSGTEALMVSIKAARAFTGRPKVAKVEGAYHGGYDWAEVSQSPSPATWGRVERPASVPLVRGVPESALRDVVVIPFNDIDRALAILDLHADELACVLLDLMPHRVGLRPADHAFACALREWTERNGALLVLDEVITFRSEFGGLQERYDLAPDLTALGKIIGGGFPVGALAGRAEVMDVMNPRSDRFVYPHSGTFSANPISMSAGLAAMELFDRDAISRLNELTGRVIRGIEAAIARTGATACVTGGGSMFRVHMKATPPHNFREAYLTPEESSRLKALLDHLFDAGFVLINTCTATLSTPMTEVEIDALVAALESGFEKIKAMP